MIAIWNDAFVFSGTGGRREPYAAHDYLKLLATADPIVADRGGAIEGTIAILAPDGRSSTIARPGELERTHLAVAPRRRRRGVARILLAWAHGEALRRGARALVLLSLPDQVEAHVLYRSLAYRRWPDRDVSLGDRLNWMAYRLDLRPSGRTLAARRSRD